MKFKAKLQNSDNYFFKFNLYSLRIMATNTVITLLNLSPSNILLVLWMLLCKEEDYDFCWR